MTRISMGDVIAGEPNLIGNRNTLSLKIVKPDRSNLAQPEPEPKHFQNFHRFYAL